MKISTTGPELELSGTRQSFAELSSALRAEYDQQLQASVGVVSFKVSSTQPCLRVQLSGDGSLLLTGPRFALENFSADLAAIGSESWPSDHLHIEFYPDHPYLCSEASPLILSVEEKSTDKN